MARTLPPNLAQFDPNFWQTTHKLFARAVGRTNIVQGTEPVVEGLEELHPIPRGSVITWKHWENLYKDTWIAVWEVRSPDGRTLHGEIEVWFVPVDNC